MKYTKCERLVCKDAINSRFNFPLYLEEIATIALAISYYMLTQGLKVIYICFLLDEALKNAAYTEL